MKLLDLFAGCGGSSEGYRQAGLEVAAVADNDEVALDSHKANHLEEPGEGCEHHLIDLTDPTDFIGYWTPGEFDVIHGSPPCQNFSPANNNPDPKKGMELVHAFEQIVAELRPTYFVMENVRTVLKYIDGFYQVKRTLNSADFGVPQTRIRAFCGRFPSPIPTHHRRGPRSRLDGTVLEKWVGAGSVLQFDGEIHTNRDQRPDGSTQVRSAQAPAPALTAVSGRQWQLWTGGASQYSETTGAKPRDLDKPAFSINANVPVSVMQFPGGGEPGSGGECRSIPRPLEKPHFTVGSRPGKLNVPAPTVTATEGKYSPGSADASVRRRASGVLRRQLTPEECMLLQGFPADYIILGNKTKRYWQIGNAVPPPMTKAIGLAIMGLGG